jgi:hypothetical protein
MRGVRLVFLIVMALSGRLALAEGSDVERAKAYFALGQADFRDHRYEGAIANFGAGYKLSPQPLFLFNIAQCARLANHAQLAIDSYQRYLAEEKDPNALPLAEAARQLNILLRARAQGAAPVTAAPPAIPARPDGTSPGATAPPTAAPAPKAAVALTTAPGAIATAGPARAGDRKRRRRTVLWSVLSSGAAASLGLGLGLSLGLGLAPPRPSLGTHVF